MNTAKRLLALAVAACTESADTKLGTTPDDRVFIGTDKGGTGSFGDTTFKSEMATDDVLDIQVHINGMVMTSLVDFKTGVIEYDGYTEASGENTQMTDDDRAAMVALAGALA